MVEDPLHLVDAHRSQARLIPDVKNHLPRTVAVLVVLALGLGVFLIEIVQRQARWWQPKRQGDEERILRSQRYARRWQPDAQMLFAADLQALGALHRPCAQRRSRARTT